MEPEASLWKTLMKFIASIGKKPDSFPDLTTVLNIYMASLIIILMLKITLSKLFIFSSVNNYAKGKTELAFYLFYGK